MCRTALPLCRPRPWLPSQAAAAAPESRDLLGWGVVTANLTSSLAPHDVVQFWHDSASNLLQQYLATTPPTNRAILSAYNAYYLDCGTGNEFGACGRSMDITDGTHMYVLIAGGSTMRSASSSAEAEAISRARAPTSYHRRREVLVRSLQELALDLLQRPAASEPQRRRSRPHPRRRGGTLDGDGGAGLGRGEALATRRRLRREAVELRVGGGGRIIIIGLGGDGDGARRPGVPDAGAGAAGRSHHAAVLPAAAEAVLWSRPRPPRPPPLASSTPFPPIEPLSCHHQGRRDVLRRQDLLHVLPSAHGRGLRSWHVLQAGGHRARQHHVRLVPPVGRHLSPPLPPPAVSIQPGGNDDDRSRIAWVHGW